MHSGRAIFGLACVIVVGLATIRDARRVSAPVAEQMLDGAAHPVSCAEACVGARAGACVDLPGSGFSACFAPGTDEEYAEAVAPLLLAAGPSAYTTSTRWSYTSTTGGTGSAGTPITLTYSFVPDNDTGNPATSNVIHAVLDAQFGSRATWKNLFRRVFDDWSAQTGIAFVEVADDGAQWPDSMGSSGVRGDMRILCWAIDGPYGVLAFNYYPNYGDMAIDKDEDWADSADDYRFFRNTIMHELGHGLGLSHVLPRDGTKLMEAFLNTGFDGPQDDDVRGVNAFYGDPSEPNGTAAAAAGLGTIVSAASFSDLSLHGPSDVDWFEINSSAGTVIAVSAAPLGASYSVGPDPGTPVAVDTRAINALRVEVYNQAGATLLAAAAGVSAGQTAVAPAVSVPGGDSGLLIKVFTAGATPATQRYALSVAPQGSSSTYTLLVGSSIGGSVPLSFSPPAQDGATTAQTPNALMFAAGVTVALTAPATAAGGAFERWEIDGATQPGGQRTVNVVMNANRAARAVYGDVLVVEAGVTKVVVAGESATLIATATDGTAPYSYTWTPSSSLSSSSAATTVATPTVTTTYTVTVTDASARTASDDVLVQVLPALNISAGPDQVVPSGRSFTLTATAGGGVGPYSYAWTPEVATADSLTGASIEASVGVTTTFAVTVTDDDGRTASDSVVVSVPPAPTVSAGADQVVRSGEFAILSATAGGGVAPYAFSWSPTGVALSTSGQSVRVLPGGNTDYTVTVTDGAGQQASDVVRVSLATALQVSAVAVPDTIRLGEAAILQVAVSGGVPPYSYTWSPATDVNAPNNASTPAAPTQPTEYTVIISDALGQSAIATVFLNVTVVASEAPFTNFSPAMPSPCGFGFALAAPFVLFGMCGLRCGARWRRGSLATR